MILLLLQESFFWYQGSTSSLFGIVSMYSPSDIGLWRRPKSSKPMHEKTLQKISTIKHGYQILRYMQERNKHKRGRRRQGSSNKNLFEFSSPFHPSCSFVCRNREQLPFLYFFNPLEAEDEALVLL